ncbi:MAG TPA: RtcB family protein [Clostridia bacterium]|nr:RtcB family protein [Clostridia bacterium]
MQVIWEGKLPIKCWATDVEEGAWQQTINLSNLPFAFSHIALMADAHEGFGMPIGGVLATQGMIIPNAVGVDIGCGVTAVRTDIIDISTRQVEKIIKNSYRVIPVGFKHHKKPREWEGFQEMPQLRVLRQEMNSAKRQIGTLGSGNHFCSIEKGSDGHIWLMVHSGSRNFGYKVANHYNKVAKNLNRKTGLVPSHYDLAPFSLDSSEGQEYYQAMSFCLEFAKANREFLFRAFFEGFAQETGAERILQKIDIHHNYAAIEHHFDTEVIVHRKGATRALQGELGVIPGSMGTPSYIVEGLGNPESFMSCSHGAGRVISRRKANELFTEEMANLAMEGVVFSGWGGDYSEAPMAYKDIGEVMSNQKDLVRPLVKLSPLGVMKG